MGDLGWLLFDRLSLSLPLSGIYKVLQTGKDGLT